MRIFACLPCRNEERNLPPLLEAFASLIATSGLDLELIAVENASDDHTIDVLRQHAKTMPLQPLQNKIPGLGPAILTGFHTALERAKDDDVVVCMDGDNTHDPAYIPEMIERIKAGADMVIASRFQPGAQEVGVSAFRRFLSHGARQLFRLALPIPGVRDFTCGYRAYRVSLIRQAIEYFGDNLIERSGFACTDELLVKMAAFNPQIEEIPFILRYDKKQGESQLPLIQTILATLKLIHSGRVLRKRIHKERKQ